jgi:probable F420-dependent oxidoreductase
MKFGYSVPNNRGVDDPRDLVDLAVAAEDMGFSSLWVSEHLFHAAYVAERLGDRPYHDPLTVLTAVACATKNARLGTSVLILPWHDPARLGKTIATLDHLSGGRVDLGVGVAVTKDEFENLGVDFHTRGRRADEVLAALQALWTQETPRFAGTFYNYEGLKFSPKPFQKPYPPLLIGGSSEAAFRRLVRFGDGWHTLRQTPNQIATARPRIEALMAEAGRDAGHLKYSIRIGLEFVDTASGKPAGDRTTLSGTADEMIEIVRAYRAAGIDEIVIDPATADKRENIDAMSRFMEQVQRKL